MPAGRRCPIQRWLFGGGSPEPRRPAAGSAHHKVGKSAGVLLPLDINPVDPSPGWALVAPVDQPLNGVLLPLKDGLDPAVRKVANPPDHPVLAGQVTG